MHVTIGKNIKKSMELNSMSWALENVRLAAFKKVHLLSFKDA